MRGAGRAGDAVGEVKQPAHLHEIDEKERERGDAPIYVSSQLRGTVAREKEKEKERAYREKLITYAHRPEDVSGTSQRTSERRGRALAETSSRRRDYHRGLHVGPETAGASCLIFTV